MASLIQEELQRRLAEGLHVHRHKHKPVDQFVLVRCATRLCGTDLCWRREAIGVREAMEQFQDGPAAWMTVIVVEP